MATHFDAIVSGADRRAADSNADANHGRPAWFKAEELRLITTARLNILLVGGSDAVRPVLEAHLRHVPKPIARCGPGDRFLLPPAAGTRTLVVHDVAALGRHEQVQLLDWMDRAKQLAQVISTSSMPLLPLVSAGSFSDRLYYRLNTVYVEVDETGDDRAAE